MTPLDDFEIFRLARVYLIKSPLGPERVAKGLRLIEGRNVNVLIPADQTGLWVERSPLSLALLRGQWAIALGLLNQGADPFLDPVERTRLDPSAPLIKAFSGALDRPETREDPLFEAVLDRLIEHGALINGSSESPPFRRPLLFCAGEGDLAFRLWATPLALARGADINAASEAGETALMICARENRAEAVSLLLAAGADDALIDEEGETALTQALFCESFEAALILLRAPSPASLRVRAGHGRGPLSFACGSTHQRAVASPERQEAIDRLLDLGEGLLEPDRRGQTPLGHLQERSDDSFKRLAERLELRWACGQTEPKKRAPAL